MSAERPLALVTGASAGLGVDLARELAACDHDLLLVARRALPMENLAEELRAKGAAVTVKSHDLGAPGAAADLYAWTQDQALAVDVLVNNAGFGDARHFHAASPDRLRGMIDLNIGALTELMRLYIADMVARGRGRVLNVASTGAFLPGPHMATYCATKAYVLSLSEAVAFEVRNTGVTVTALCPGPTKTDFFTAAEMSDAILSNPLTQSAAQVAKIGVAGMLAGKSVVVSGPQNKVSAAVGRYLPRRLLLPLTDRVLRGHKAETP